LSGGKADTTFPVEGDRNKRKLVDLIGSRVIEARSSNAKKRVVVRVARPKRHRRGGFRCEYQIIGLGDDTIRFGAGLDALQALQIALRNIGAELYLRYRELDLRLDGSKDLGFPKPSKWM
jgi:hypothetical protein